MTATLATDPSSNLTQVDANVAPISTESTALNVTAASAAESTSANDTTTATTNTTAASTPTISAGLQLNQLKDPISTQPAIVGTPGDRYLFTESPVEYYYYHQPVVKKVQPTIGLTTGGTPIEISGAWFD